MSEEHSPLPWYSTKLYGTTRVYTGDLREVAAFGEHEAADAEHIVKCVNAYPTLEAENKRLREALELADRSYSALLQGVGRGSVDAWQWLKPIERTQAKVQSALKGGE